MLADAHGDDARPRRRADAHPPLATPTAVTDMTNREIAHPGDDANAPVAVDSLRLNAAHCRHRRCNASALDCGRVPGHVPSLARRLAQALRAALAASPCLASTVSPVAMLADARGDRACLRLRADAHPPRQRRRQRPTCRNAIQHEPSHPQRHGIRDLIDDNSGDATAQVNVGSLRLNAAHCRRPDPRVALARVRFPRAGRNAPAKSASLALRAALADLPCPAPPVSPVAMLADARGDRARRHCRQHLCRRHCGSRRSRRWHLAIVDCAQT